MKINVTPGQIQSVLEMFKQKDEAMQDLDQVKVDQGGKALSMAYLDKRLNAIEKMLGMTTEVAK